ncbi:MAG TPA: hypothetical protein VKB75_13535 [Jatrophihabitans sp.]|nr:hypothetical protein [Jatrophihabitans sp.]
MTALAPAGWSLADDVGLVISELVTDAHDRGAAQADVNVDVHFDHVELRIVDDRPRELYGPADDIAARARQRILDTLADDLVTDMTSNGSARTVAELTVDPTHTRTLACEQKPV